MNKPVKDRYFNAIKTLCLMIVWVFVGIFLVPLFIIFLPFLWIDFVAVAFFWMFEDLLV